MRRINVVVDDGRRLANKYACEACDEILENLYTLGYNAYLNGNVKELLAEYWNKTGFNPKRY